MKQSIILGNIITMDDKRPFAKAALVKNGVFAYIGNAEEAKKLASKDAQANIVATIIDGEEVFKA